MTGILFKGLGVILILHGVYSIYTSIKGGPLTGVMMPSDTFLFRKLFGEKASNRFYNMLWGIIEVIFGLLILIGKFD